MREDWTNTGHSGQRGERIDGSGGMVFSALRDRHDRHVLPSSGLPYPTVPLPHGRGLHVMYGVSGVGLERGALQTR